ncbi:MAG: UDP-N-acetylmuramoyl-L-alanine--D-glutamate ligase [Acidimicrobiales bacterium]
MYRPTGFADLAGRRVGVFGYGVEGRAAAARLALVGADVVVVDDADLGAESLMSDHGGHEALLACVVVLKSPGVPRRRSDVIDLEAHGVAVTSALNLWLHDVDRTRVVAVTGTKGKSTTTALITFFLTCLDEEAQSLGNIGQPPYSPEVDSSAGWLIVEVSSFQCVDLDLAPATIVVTSLGADHLDWHGSLAQYREDKLSLTRAPGAHRTFVADTPELRGLHGELGGDVTVVAADDDRLAAALGLIGRHNDRNVALALAVAASLTRRSTDEIRAAARARASRFEPLPGRLTVVATDRGVRYVDDGLATSVLPVVAALAVFDDEPLALIAGGFDRGVDYSPLVTALARRHGATFVAALGPAGERIAAAIATDAPGVVVAPATSMVRAVGAAAAFLTAGGVVLLSPGAPSFDAYHDWLERSADFQRCVLDLIRRSET